MIKIRLIDLSNIISHYIEVHPVEPCEILAGKIGNELKEVLKMYTCESELGGASEYRTEAEGFGREL